MKTSLTLLLLLVMPAAFSQDDMAMRGAFGSYSMSREASGTSWQPQAVPLQGLMQVQGGWMTMLHGYIDQIHDHQGGPRGGDKDFSASMLMFMGQRRVGDDTLGIRAMLSLDPFMGKGGYPLLLQTGESADGVHPLVDRQHPHDFFMELSGSYSHPLDDHRSVFLYAGLPGEPALGPPAFMHRASGLDIPEAPISHHWLDSTHVADGVLTLGYVEGEIKFEASVFHGREPDQFRWNVESGSLDSAAARVSWNPDDHWALQLSDGYIHSPEQLAPDVSQHRVTVSAMRDDSFGDDNRWDTTLAWGQDDNRPGNGLDAWLLETEVLFHRQDTLFARAERVQEDELLGNVSGPPAQPYAVAKVSIGYIHDWQWSEHLRFGLGGLLSAYVLPTPLQTAYGSPQSYMLFVRLKLE